MILHPDILLDLYSHGIFPMADNDSGEISLYSPDPRAIIDLNRFHISDTLRKTYRSNRFEIRFNTCFERVMRLCADRVSTWISEDLIESYLQLHKLNYAFSVEAWKDNTLAGGLYGVAINGAFFGESMFHVTRDASKVALVALVDRMKNKKMALLDTQYITPHLKRFGAIEISREKYLQILKQALSIETCFYS